MKKTLSVKSRKRLDSLDMTKEVSEIVSLSGTKEGICLVFTGHTTVGLSLNECHDPYIGIDIQDALEEMVPKRSYHHDKEDGNTRAHIKSALIGNSITIPISSRRLCLGRWQGIWMLDFDGPRDREIVVKIIGG